ncbi:MAG: thioredoxin fold domain-containing protein [Halieaceae bacterium]|jgi:thioredoxin-related protein|nr:thioredoxin fold domain-containing protein [Halieaceae bacterium]
MSPHRLLTSLLLLLPLAVLPALAAEQETGEDDFRFDDTPLEDVLTYPDWFKQSFLLLDEDLEEAVAAGKFGIAVYFGQKRCAYCKKLMDVNFQTPDIVKYTREHFDVIPIDIWSPEEVTTPDGRTLGQRDYALSLNTNFTPSLVFYDRDGRIALRLRGYYPPYQFRAALEYVAGGHYQREPFPVYMARGDSTLRFEKGDLVEQPFFERPPYNLDRSRMPGSMPLVVFFEQGNCHACDVLHTDPLSRSQIRERFEKFETVQLDMWSDTPVITPQGKATTAREWARDLGIFYAPSILFFDEYGREIVRLDSVTQFFRLRNVLNYVMSKGYLSERNYLVWSSRTRRLLQDSVDTMRDMLPGQSQ